MTPEDTPRMAERTDRQAQIDGMFDACRQVANSLPLFVIVGTTAMANPLGSDLEHTDERRFNPSGKVFARVEDAAALLRERDAQIASLELRVLWQVGEADELAKLTGLLESWCRADAHDKPADSGWGKRLVTADRVNVLARKALAELATLRAERDAAQQEIEKLQHDYAILSKMMARETEILREEQQEVKTLREALKQLRIDANRLCDRQLGGSYEDDCRLSIAKADAALSSSPRPQEPQPPESPKPTEPRKPVVNLMEALKKSLDSLNAKRSQEPGGHQP